MSTHNFIHKALLLVACLMPHVAVWGQIVGSTFWTDNLQYRVLNEQEVEVIGLKDRYGVYEIQIPSTVTAVDWNNKTYTITTIGDSAFSDCNGLTNINIPNSVTTIGNGAFQNSYLSNINIPNSVSDDWKRCFLRLRQTDKHQYTQFSQDDWERCFLKLLRTNKHQYTQFSHDDWERCFQEMRKTGKHQNKRIRYNN